jgi:hypothetical protein
MTPEQRAESMAQAERWLDAKGLPYFIYRERRSLVERHRKRQVITLVAAAVVVSAGVGVVAGLLSSAISAGVAVASGVLLLLVLGYGWAFLELRPILLWAAWRTVGSPRLMFRLLTRALPLLLLFMTFLFINTEVWQVASELPRGRLWMGVLMFGAIAIAFLLVRLPDEVRQVEDEASDDRLVECCAGTPLASAAATLHAYPTRLSRIPRANLVTVLLFSQLLQVLALSLTVFAFFLVFGMLAIEPDVIQSWLGHPPRYLPSVEQWVPVSQELFQVSVFLAGFAGLYFTVYAVTDSTYRDQFFSSLSRELEQAIGVYTVYETLRHEDEDDAEEAAAKT